MGLRLSIAAAIGGSALFFCTAAGANPWLKEKGEAEFISSVTASKEQAGFAASVQSTSAFHIEYGADPRATLIFDADLQQYASSTGRRTNFDNAWTGIRTALFRWDNSLLSTEWVAGISGVQGSGLPGSRISLDGTAEARLMFGQGFELFARHAFFGIEGGWRWRAGPPADEAVFDATFGIAPWPSALVMLQSFSIVGTGQGSGAYRRYDLSKVQFSIAQSLTKRMWIQLGVVDQVAGSGNSDPGAVIALWLKY